MRDADARLNQLIESATGEAPCDLCPTRARCAAELLACSAFSGFFHGEAPKRWRAFPRVPRRELYAALFDNPQSATSAARARGGRPRKVREDAATA